VAAVRTFTEKVDSGILDVASVMPSFSAEELATHERIAKRLKLVGAS
jgi:hypothetical protein